MIRSVGAALLLSVSVMAAVPAAADPVAFQAITSGDYANAERVLARQVTAGSVEPGVLLNLAHVYRHTARPAQATALYRRVLAEPDVQMARPDGSPVGSHRLATAGLERSAQFAVR